MKYNPHVYQQHATQMLLDKPEAGLLLDMGLGKTISTLTAIAELLDMLMVVKVLVIAPLRVAQTVWATEATKWDHTKHLKIAKVLGSSQQRIAALNQQVNIYVINRENIPWLVEHYGRQWPFDMVVVDESSSFKDGSTKRFKALRKVRPLIDRIVILTGTPAPNTLMDLWSQLYLLDRGERLGQTIGGYRARYFFPEKQNGAVVFSWKLHPGADQVVYDKIGDICISMKSEDWLDLPPLIHNVVKVQLDPAARRLYDQLERDWLLPFSDGDVDASSAAVLGNKLLQLSNGAVYSEDRKVQEIHQAKLDCLAEIVDESSDNILVFYNYKHDLSRIKARFPQARELKTEEDIKDWNDGKINLLLAHPAAAGHGLNLQSGGHCMIWFSCTWSLEQYEQAIARLHRQGQTQSVIVHHLVTENSMDEQVMLALQRKASGQGALMQAVKAQIHSIS